MLAIVHCHVYHLQHTAPTAEQRVDVAPSPGPQLLQLPLAHPLPVLRLAKHHLRHGAGGISHGAEPGLLCHSHLGTFDAAQGLVLAREVDDGPLALANKSVFDPHPHGDSAHAAAAAEVADVLHDLSDQGRDSIDTPDGEAITGRATCGVVPTATAIGEEDSIGVPVGW